MLLGQHCSWLSTILNNIVEPELARNQVQQCRTILLTTLNNVAPTTLLHPVFNSIAYAHTTSVSVIFFIVICYKVSNLIGNHHAVRYQRIGSQKFYQRSYIVNLSAQCNAKAFKTFNEGAGRSPFHNCGR